MHDMNRREREALDRHITGNYGEDQIRDEAVEVETARVTIDKGSRVMVLNVPAYTVRSSVLDVRITGDILPAYLQGSAENETGISLADFGFYCLARAAQEDPREMPR